jgi:hypothetical protein
MCTTVVIAIEIIEPAHLEGLEAKCADLALENGFFLSMESFSGEQRKLIELTSAIVPQAYFPILRHPNDRCSCKIIEGIQSDAISSETKRNPLFSFVWALLHMHHKYKKYRLVIAFSEDPPVNLKFKKTSFEAFEKEVLHHYGWLTKEEKVGWEYDINVVFELCME